MASPAFTMRNVLLYLISVAALLLVVYLLFVTLNRAEPRKSIPMEPGAHAVALRLDRV